MNRTLLRAFRKLADKAEMELDERSGVIYGSKRGYNVFIHQVEKVKAFYITLSIKRQGQMPEHSEMNEIVTATKLLNGCEVIRYKVRFQVQLGPGLSYDNAFGKALDALDDILAALYRKGFENACQNCASQEGLDRYFIGSAPAYMCPSCYHDYCASIEERRQSAGEKRETVIGGLVGAFLGTLLGVVCIVLLGQLGYVASLSGLIMGVCALKGYEMLGRKLSRKGIFISVLLMVAMVYVGQRIDFAIEVAKVFEVDVITAFRSVSLLVGEKVIEPAVYYGNLAMLYLFTALGAVPTIVNILKSKKEVNVIYRMGV